MLGSEDCKAPKRQRLRRLKILIKERFLLPSIPEKEYSGLALTEYE